MPADESISPLRRRVGESCCFGPAKRRAASTPTSPRLSPYLPNDSSWTRATWRAIRDSRAVTSYGSMSWRGRAPAKSSSRASVQSFCAISHSIRNRFYGSEILDTMYLAAEISSRPATEVALREFDHVYSFIYARVGNRADAEDLTQQVAVKALPRLRNGYPEPAVRAYLYATARSVMATFWCHRSRAPEAELADDIWVDGRGGELAAPLEAAAWVERTLNALPANYRRVLELRFLRGYSLHETADEMGKTVGGVKVMQLRALRAAARLG